MKSNKLTSRQIEVISGHLLGDGFLGKDIRCKNAHFKIVRKLSDLRYLRWSAKELKSIVTERGVSSQSIFDTRTNKRYYRCVFRTRCSEYLTEIYNKWYVNKIKILPSELELTPLIIAIWLADDGHIVNTSPGSLGIKFATHCFSFNEITILEGKLRILYGNKIKHYKEKNKEQWTIRSTDTATSKLILRDVNLIFPPLSRKSSVWREERIDLYDKEIKPKCPICEEGKVYKNGIRKGTTQIYYCLSCKLNFREGQTRWLKKIN